MKKIHYLLCALVLGTTALASPVTKNTAQSVSLSFFNQHSSAVVSTVNLAYTEMSATGEAVYFVFNINSNDGFVIIAADDAAHPILGYSTKGQFVIPAAHSTVGAWLKKRKSEVLEIRSNHYPATPEISNEWSGNMTTANRGKSAAGTLPTAISPMVKSTWNQSPYYNDLCPGGSVTGCVATAMAQIMRFWSYPARGTGSSSYCDCTSNGDAVNYGTLSANYGATTYNWANMSLAVNSPNAAVATLMYDCGVSVDMNYAPNGSGAWVITADSSICAQNSYVQYFGYDPSTIQGLIRANYTDSVWLSMIKSDLNIGRPVQYVGDDSLQGGHTWVCDGYDASDMLDMNWGWAGQDDGYFSINALNPGGQYNFALYQEVLLGIRPLAKTANDAGVFAIVTPTTTSVCTNNFKPIIAVGNFGDSTLKSCVINYMLDGGTVQTQNWSGKLAVGGSVNDTLPGFSTSSGAHTIIFYTTLPNGLPDGNNLNDTMRVSFYDNSAGAALPVIEGFEGSANLPAGWALSDFPDSLATWQVSSTIAHTGNYSIGFNNCQGEGNTSMKGRRDRFMTTSYDFSGTPAGSMAFDVAYTTVLYQDTVYADTLVVYYSADCGSTWNRIYYKGGITLATAPQYTSVNNCWSPTASEWRTENIGLSALAGKPSVMFAFESRSDWGEYIYIDNINISPTSTAGIAELNSSTGLFVYPNPASSSLTLSGSQNTGKVFYTISDVSGREVKTGDIDAGAGNFKQTVSISDLAHGIYILKVNDEKNAWVRKIVVQ